MVPWLRLARPGLKSQREPEQRRQVLDHAKRMPGLRFRAEIWMLRVAKAWPRPCPSAVQVPCALNLAFLLQPLGFNGAMLVGRILTALTTLVSVPWPSLGSPGARDPMRMEQFLSTVVLQRLRHHSRRRRKVLALMPWALGHLSLDGQAIHIWPPC